MWAVWRSHAHSRSGGHGDGGNAPHLTCESIVSRPPVPCAHPRCLCEQWNSCHMTRNMPDDRSLKIQNAFTLPATLQQRHPWERCSSCVAGINRISRDVHVAQICRALCRFTISFAYELNLGLAGSPQPYLDRMHSSIKNQRMVSSRPAVRTRVSSVTSNSTVVILCLGRVSRISKVCLDISSCKNFAPSWAQRNEAVSPNKSQLLIAGSCQRPACAGLPPCSDGSLSTASQGYGAASRR